MFVNPESGSNVLKKANVLTLTLDNETSYYSTATLSAKDSDTYIPFQITYDFNGSKIAKSCSWNRDAGTITLGAGLSVINDVAFCKVSSLN